MWCRLCWVHKGPPSHAHWGPILLIPSEQPFDNTPFESHSLILTTNASDVANLDTGLLSCPDLSNSPFYWFLSLDSQDSYFWVLASIWGPITVDYFASFVNGKCPSSIRNFFNLLVLVVYSLAFDWGRESCLLVPPVCSIPRVILIRSLPEITSTTESQHRSLQDASKPNSEISDAWDG